MDFSFKPPRSLLGGFGTWYNGRQKEEDRVSGTPGVEENPTMIVDLYGFECAVNSAQLMDVKKCEAKARSREIAWRNHRMKGDLSSLRKSGKFKIMVRKGVPPSLRAWVWMETSGARERMEGAGSERGYKYYLEKSLIDSPFARQIELDLPRTYPEHPWVSSDAGQKALGRILLAYGARNPRTGYCQSMNYIAAMLLLVTDKNEEKSFWLLATLIEDILYAGTYEKNLNGCHVEMRSLGELVANKLPRLSKHLDELYCDMSIIATDWFLCIFSTSLPSETCVRVWDSLFNEGPKILFRVSVALLRMCEKTLFKFDNAGELLRGVKESIKTLHHRDKLMKIAFDGIGGLPMNTIKSIRKTKQLDVDKMLRQREERMGSVTLKTKAIWLERDEEDSNVDSDGQSSIATAITDIMDLPSDNRWQ